MDKSTKEINEKYNDEIMLYLRVSTFPLAVKMIRKGENIDQKYKRPKNDFDADMPLCQAVNICRRNAWTLYLDKDDITCGSAIIYLGLARAPEAYVQGDVAFAPYNQDRAARKKRSECLPKFQVGKYCGILISPLLKAEFIPDSVLIYGNSAQMMRLIQSAVFKSGESLSFNAQGGGSCSMEIVGPILDKEVKLVIPGNGARIFGGVHDDEIVFGIPNEKLDDMVRWLRETHEGGQRYPIPKYSIYRPKMPRAYEELLKTLRNER